MPALALDAARACLRPAVLVPVAVALLALAVHAPALRNGFVNWDDHINFVTNPHYRGLSPAHLAWMFGTVLMGQWIPLTWISLGLDFVLWGMEPFGYHLTSIVLHAANAAVFCLVVRRLLGAALAPARATGWVPAAAGALFFALHPLRAESVAWVTERRDVLSGLFFLLAMLAYLVAQQGARERTRPWLLVSLACFTLAGLCKSIVVTLPVLLLLLDVYPLRRIAPGLAAWLTPQARNLVAEKLPYLVVALFVGVMQVYAQIANRFLTSLEALPPVDRIVVAFYSFWFYPSTTLLPVGLSPLYELPARVSLREPRFVLAVAGTLVVTATFVALRRRWPAGLTAWLAYGIMVLPVSGLIHNGHQLAHDRYSYLSCLPWAVLFGAAVAAVVAAIRRGTIRPAIGRMALAGLGLWLVALSAFTWQQVAVWRDTDTLWRYALEGDPECAICHQNLGVSLHQRGLLGPAIESLERSIALRPDRVRNEGNLGLALLVAGRTEEATGRFERVLARYPTDADARTNLAVALRRQHRDDEAIAHLRRVLEGDPRHVAALTNLGLALLERNETTQALAYIEQAAELSPDTIPPRASLVRAYAAAGRHEAAVEQLEILRTLDPAVAAQVGPALVTVW